jgi:hypothetical protein
VVERRNMIMHIYEGELALRVCFRGSFVSFCDFEIFLALHAILLGLPLFMPFAGLAVSLSSR